MTTNLKKITSAILTTFMLTSVSANAAEGVDEYLHSEAFSETVDVVSNTISEIGDNIASGLDEINLPIISTEDNTFEFAKTKSVWNTEDIISIYRQGYSLEDIETAIEYSKKLDVKPFALLEKKGKPEYTSHEIADESSETDETAEPEYIFEKSEKSWDSVLAELAGNTAVTDESLQFIKEYGLTDYIDMSVFSNNEVQYLNTDYISIIAEDDNASVMSAEETASATSTSSSTPSIEDIYNNIVFPDSKYSQFNTSNTLSTEEINVNPLTRNATVRATDLSLKGRNGLDLNLTRVNSNINTGNVTPVVKSTLSSTTGITKSFYSLTGYARVEIEYNEPLANGSTTQTFDSELIVFKPYDTHIGANPVYNIAGNEALAQDRERLSQGRMPSAMFESQSAANAAKTKAADGEYDKLYSFGSNSKIKSVRFTVIDDSDLFTVTSEGTYTIYSDPEGEDIYLTVSYDHNLTDKYFDIGIGWEFDFPYIERLYTNTSDNMGGADYLHFGSKGVWRITEDNKLDGYYLNDLTVTMGGTFNNQSCYTTVTEKTGKKYYFGNLGQLLGIEDRFGNNIKFEYSAIQLYDGHYYPYRLTKITDTVGREITFDYTNPLQTVVTVADPNDTTKNQVIKYNKTLMNDEDDDYVLSSVVDAENNETVYEYKTGILSYALTSKEFTEDYYLDVTHYYLQKITKPSKMQIKFTTNSPARNCGNDGIANKLETLYYEINEPVNAEATRFSNYWYKDFNIDVSTNSVTYDGYPDYRNKAEIPDDIIIVSNSEEMLWGGESKLILNEYSRSENDNWLCQTETVYLQDYTTKEYYWRERVDYEYNNKEQCTKETYKKFNSPTSQVSHQDITTEYEYNNYNDLLKVTRFGSDEYAISYEYDSTYHLPTKKTYKQDANTTVIENYTLTTDKKSVAQVTVTENNTTRRKLGYTYDTYGNVISEKRYTGENSWNDYVQIGYSYDDLSTNTHKINGANLSRIYASGIKDIDGNNVGTDGTIEYTYTYDWFGNILIEKDCNGNVYTYAYDKLNRPTVLTNPEQGTIGIAYSTGALNNYVQVTNENGNVMKYTYLSTGAITEEKDVTANKVLKSYSYSGVANPYYTKTQATIHSDFGNTSITTTLTDALGRTVSTEITDSENNVLYREEYTYQQAVNNLYDVVTKTIKAETADKDSISKQYTDQFGNVVKEEVIYNNNGTNQTLTTEYTYDYVGNLLSVKSPRATAENWSGNLYTAQYEYGIDGQVTKTTDIFGNYAINEYDGLGRLIRSADAEATAAETPYYTTYVYDALGRVLKTQTPVDVTQTAETLYYYDNNSNVIKTKVKNGANSYSTTETTYNWRNAPTKVLTDGTDVAYYYDAVGNVLRRYTGELTNFVMNGLDNVSSNTSYKVKKYTYDTQNREITNTDVYNKTGTMTYDINGNKIKTVGHNGYIVNEEYDPIGNVIKKSTQSNVSSPESEIYTYTYNRLGLPATMTGSGITTTYTYDNLGRLVAESLTNGTVKEYNYDSNGNRTQFKLTVDGTEKINTVYTYDKLDRLQTVTNGTNTSTYTYNKNGQLLTNATSGFTTNYIYNKGGLVTNLNTVKGENTIQSHSYSYTPNGFVSQKQSTVGNVSKQHNYLYDNAGRLTSEQIGDDVTTYTYDAWGNRASMTNGNISYIYYSEAHDRMYTVALLKDNVYQYNTMYTFDDNGNTISWSTTYNSSDCEEIPNDSGTMAYDGYNRLRAYYTDDVYVFYNYDGNNLRRSKSVNGVTTEHIWDGSDIVMDSTGTSENIYYRGATGIEYASLGGNVSYYQKDAHGDITALTGADGTITKSYLYDAFGNEEETTTTDLNPFRYCGEYFDYENGMIYLRNRYYEPSIGRFITEDPIRDGLNWYLYAENNPVNFWDYWGLEDVYIFYGEEHGENGGFNNRANAEYNEWIKKGRTVKIVAINTEDEFIKEWNNMNNGEKKIEKVSLYFHSNPTTLILDYTKNEYMTTNVNGETDSGSSATYIGILDNKEIITLCLYACNSAHLDYSNNLAITFFETQNIYQVYGWDGSMRWGYITGKPTLANNQEYFYSWINFIDRMPQGLIRYRWNYRGEKIQYIAGTWDNRGGL